MSDLKCENCGSRGVESFWEVQEPAGLVVLYSCDLPVCQDALMNLTGMFPMPLYKSCEMPGCHITTVNQQQYPPKETFRGRLVSLCWHHRDVNIDHVLATKDYYRFSMQTLIDEMTASMEEGMEC